MIDVILRMDKSTKTDIDPDSELSFKDATEIIGKTVENIEASEYTLTLHFSDGSNLWIQGVSWVNSPLGVTYSK